MRFPKGNTVPDPVTRAYLDALVLAIASGGSSDRDDRAYSAFEELYDYYAKRIKGWLMADGMPEHLAEEIAQDTMLMVWRKAALFNPAKGPARSWLFTLARNCRMDRLRRELSQTGALPCPAEYLSPPSPEEVNHDIEEEGQLHRAKELLPESQAKLLTMVYCQGKPHAEAAKEQGIPLGTVKSRLRLAISRMRSILHSWRS